MHFRSKALSQAETMCTIGRKICCVLLILFAIHAFNEVLCNILCAWMIKFPCVRCGYKCVGLSRSVDYSFIHTYNSFFKFDNNHNSLLSNKHRLKFKRKKILKSYKLYIQ